MKKLYAISASLTIGFLLTACGNTSVSQPSISGCGKSSPQQTETTVQTSSKVATNSSGGKGYIDSPTNGATIQGQITVQGWALDRKGVSKVEVLVDSKIVGTALYGISRPDVQIAFPDYQNANSGYQYLLNTNDLSNGQHTVTVQETGKNGGTAVLDNIQVNVQGSQEPTPKKETSGCGQKTSKKGQKS